MNRLSIVETGPRDGLQNEAAVISTASKVEMIRRAAAAGAQRIEVTSFVSPRAVPQLADADDVVRGLEPLPDVALSALIANRRGAERALAAGILDIDFVLLATDTFSLRNQGMSSNDALALVGDLAGFVHSSRGSLTVTIGAAFGCPFEGEVALARVLDLGAKVLASGADELSYADTIGVGTPHQVRALIAGTDPGARLRFHFHNTRNTGYANAFAAMEAGVTTLDATTGGIGGCPFAPNATGNIATEDLVYLAQRLGVETGLDPERLADNARWTSDLLGHQVPGLLSRAGGFPPVHRLRSSPFSTLPDALRGRSSRMTRAVGSL